MLKYKGLGLQYMNWEVGYTSAHNRNFSDHLRTSPSLFVRLCNQLCAKCQRLFLIYSKTTRLLPIHGQGNSGLERLKNLLEDSEQSQCDSRAQARNPAPCCLSGTMRYQACWYIWLTWFLKYLVPRICISYSMSSWNLAVRGPMNQAVLSICCVGQTSLLAGNDAQEMTRLVPGVEWIGF